MNNNPLNCIDTTGLFSVALMSPSFKDSAEFSMPKENYTLGNFYSDLKEGYRDSCLGVIGALDYKYTGGVLNADFARTDPVNAIFNTIDALTDHAYVKQDLQRYSPHVQARMALQDCLICGELPLPTGSITKSTCNVVTKCVNKGANLNLIDLVIRETMENKGSITSRYKLSALEALQAGEKFLGVNYREIGKPGSGVFRSLDGLRQFRMDAKSIVGDHAPGMPHIHLEIFRNNSTTPYINNHIQFYE